MIKVIKTENAPKAIGPYSQAIVMGNTIYVSGQIPIDPATGNLVEGCIKCNTKRALNNIKSILEEAGFSFKNVVKTTVYLADMNDFAAMNEVYAEYFSEPYPARACFQVASLPKGAKVEIEVVAMKD